MTWLEHARSLFAYNEWANQKLLEAAAGLNEDEFGRQVSGSYESVRMSVVHIVLVQGLWLSVLNGKPEVPPPPQEFAGIPFDELKRRFARSHDDLRAYAADLTEERMAAEISTFHPRERKEYRWPAWQLVTHLTNHSAHHRAEAGIMLALLGHSPGDLDFLYFVGQRT